MRHIYIIELYIFHYGLLNNSLFFYLQRYIIIIIFYSSIFCSFLFIFVYFTSIYWIKQITVNNHCITIHFVIYIYILLLSIIKCIILKQIKYYLIFSVKASFIIYLWIYQVSGLSLNVVLVILWIQIERSCCLENFTGCKWGQCSLSVIFPWLQSTIEFAFKHDIINGTAFSRNTEFLYMIDSNWMNAEIFDSGT